VQWFGGDNDDNLQSQRHSDLRYFPPSLSSLSSWSTKREKKNPSTTMTISSGLYLRSRVLLNCLNLKLGQKNKDLGAKSENVTEKFVTTYYGS
jgi:hypothetical protein